MTDERNFRSSYYEKVGCRGVEEKKSLEILMKEKPWDKNKLKQFCLRFTVPAAYRNIVWKVLLDILPVYPDSHTYVLQQRTEQYEDLLYAAQLFGMVRKDMSPSEVLLQMWMLDNEYQEPPVFPDTDCNPSEAFIRISTSLFSLYGCSVDVYWLSCGLLELVKGTHSRRDMGKLCQGATTMLEKEDPRVYGHLKEIEALEVLPLTKWFSCCFAGVLDDTSLAKIWDKICSGAPKILSFVAVILIISLRRNILRATTAQEVAKCVSEFPETCEDVVANKAIELWQYYGAQPQNDQLQLAKK